jgi:peptide subunit release factor RF-3
MKAVLKRKQLDKGLQHLAQEGAIQVFPAPSCRGWWTPSSAPSASSSSRSSSTASNTSTTCDANFTALPYTCARWITTKDGKVPEDVSRFNRAGISQVFHDQRGLPIVLFRDDWTMKYAVRNHEDTVFHQAAPHIAE